MKITDSGMPPEDLWSSFFSPQEILIKLGASSNMARFVDLGCGYGTFAIPAAKMFSDSEIIAMDIENEMIETVTRKAQMENVSNLVAVHHDFIAAGTGLEDQSVDYVMLFNILHAENPIKILAEAFRILKKGAKAGIIHWIHDSSTPRGPALKIRPKPEQCRTWAIEAGFKIIDENVSLPPYHYGMQIAS